MTTDRARIFNRADPTAFKYRGYTICSPEVEDWSNRRDGGKPYDRIDVICEARAESPVAIEQAGEDGHLRVFVPLADTHPRDAKAHVTAAGHAIGLLIRRIDEVLP